MVKSTIALVDDDRNILITLSIALESEGFSVRTYSDGEAALAALREEPVDLAVLDIKMPRLDGLEMLSRLRRESQIPVIFLTSKDDEIDEALGLRLGADDYITKPFSHRLLVERIRAVLRRAQAASGTERTAETAVRGDLVLDSERHLCQWKGDEITLTVTEFFILRSLVDRPGIVKSREQLMDAAYGENIYVDDRTIDSHIKRLRRKFKHVDHEFNQIETLYGIGYRYKQA